MLTLIIFWLHLFFNSAFLGLHDFHAALATVKQNSKEKSLEITLRVFTDDLELAVANQTKQKFRLSLADSVESEVKEYIKGSFFIHQSGKPLEMEFLGKEFDNDVCYLYIESKYDKLNGELLIEFSTLTEIFEDQNNLMNVTLDKKKETLLFDRNKKIQLLKP